MAIRIPTNYDATADIIADLEDMADSIQDELDLKVDKVTGKGLSTNDYSTEEKNKLAGVEAQANKTVVDVSLNETSTNPVQNKAVYAEFAEKQEQIDDLVEENSTLKKQIPTAHISTTSIQLTDSAEDLPIEHVKLKGATSQQQYEGKNFANIHVITNLSNQFFSRQIVGDTIVLSNNTNSSGYLTTEKKLSQICPNLKVDDVVKLSFNTTTTTSQPKNAIYLAGINELWYINGIKTITQEMLDSTVILYGGYNETAVISEFMIRLSSVTDETYEPYTGGQASPSPAYPQTIHRVTGDCGSKISSYNQLGIVDGDYSINNISVKVKSGIISIVGEISANTNIFIPLIMPILINKGEKNTLTAIVTGNTYTEMAMRLLTSTTINADNSFGNSFFSLSPNTATSLNSIQTETKTYNYLMVRVNTGHTYNVTIKTQLESGLSYTTYSEFQGIQNTPLSLGNIEAYEGDEIEIDYVQKAGYKKVTGARLVQNMGKKTFSNEDVFYSVSEGYYMNFKVKATTPRTLLCNRYVNKVTYSTFMASDYAISMLYSSTQLYIRDKDVSSASELLQKLINNNTEIIYKLATPVITPITDPTLLAQLETLINMKTYKEVTNIDLTGEDLAPVLDCDYYQDMSTVKSDIASIKARLDLLEE